MEVLPPLSEEDRMLSGLSYPFWPVVPPLVLLGPRREEPFVHFHALQALALGVVSTVGTLFLAVALAVFYRILPGGDPTISGVVGVGVFVVGWFAFLFYLSFLFYTAWRAAAGRFLRLPILGRWAEQRMRRALELDDDSFRTDPLQAPAAEEDGEPLRPDAAELLRLHRQETQRRPEPPPAEFRYESLVEEAPVEEPAGGRFQPGLFPQNPRPATPSSSRKFRWNPLDEEAEETEAEPPATGGFQAW